MSDFLVTLRIDKVGDKEAMAALETLAAKGRTVSTTTTEMGSATKAATHAFGEHTKAVNKIGRAMESLAVESLGAKAQLGLVAGELGKMAFGGVAMLAVTAGIFAITKAWEVFTEKAKEAKQAQEALNQKIAEAANAGNSDVIAAEGRKIQFGQPFGKDGKLVANSRFVQGAFAGSLLDLQAQLKDAQDRFYSESNGFAQIAIQKEIVRIKAEMAPLQAMMTSLRSAASNVASQPADNAGRLGTITTTATGPGATIGAGLGKSVADAYQKELASDLKLATALAVQQGVENAEIAFTAQHSVLAELLPTKEQIADGIKDVSAYIMDAIANDPILARGKMAAEMGAQMGRMISDGLAQTLVSALDAGFEKAFSGAGAVGFIEGFGQAVLGALGSVMEQMGAALVSYGIAMTLFADGMTNPFTSGPAAIAAGAALVALGAALSAAVHGHGGGGHVSAGGFSGGSGGLAGIIDRGVINPDTYSSRGMAGVSPRGGDTFVFYGANDPQAVRWLDEMDRKRQQRGSLVPRAA